MDYSELIDNFPDQCGMRIISSLDSDSDVKTQINILKKAFYEDDYRAWDEKLKRVVGRILITDVAGKPRWKETKKLAKKVGEFKNPNTGNKIIYWECSVSIIKKLKALLKTK